MEIYMEKSLLDRALTIVIRLLAVLDCKPHEMVLKIKVYRPYRLKVT